MSNFNSEIQSKILQFRINGEITISIKDPSILEEKLPGAANITSNQTAIVTLEPFNDNGKTSYRGQITYKNNSDKYIFRDFPSRKVKIEIFTRITKIPQENYNSFSYDTELSNDSFDDDDDFERLLRKIFDESLEAYTLRIQLDKINYKKIAEINNRKMIETARKNVENEIKIFLEHINSVEYQSKNSETMSNTPISHPTGNQCFGYANSPYPKTNYSSIQHNHPMGNQCIKHTNLSYPETNYSSMPHNYPVGNQCIEYANLPYSETNYSSMPYNHPMGYYVNRMI